MNARLKRMVGHGAIVMIIALVAGFGLVFSLIGGAEVFPGVILQFDVPSDPAGWARTHAGGLMNGMMVLLFVPLLAAMQLPDRMEFQLYWMLVGTGYANTLFYWGGMLSPTRSVTFGDSPLGATNIFGVIGALPAFIFAFILIYAMVILARHAFREAAES